MNNRIFSGLSDKTYCYLSSALIACFSLLLGACSTVSDVLLGKEDRYLDDVPSYLVIDKLWSVSAVGSFKNDYFPFMPLVEENRIYVCGPKGKIAAFNADDGKQVWSASLSEALVAGVGGGNGILLLGTAKGEALAVAEDSKTVLWRRGLGSRISAISENYKNTVIVRTEDNTTFAFRSDDGRLLWRRTDQAPALTIRGANVPLFYEDKVFLGLDDGRVLIIELANGKMLNQIKIGVSSGESDLDRIVDVDGRMLIRNDTFFATAYQGRAIALDLSNSRLLWLADAPSHVGIDVGREAMYVTTPENQVLAHNLLNGERLWSNSRMMDTELSAPISMGTLVAVATDRGDIYWLSRKSGKLLDKSDVGGAPVVSLLSFDNRKLIAFDKSGDLTALYVKGYRKAK
ncbi:MAG: outer membrane protein assembly factor BamB [Chromatiales bacterium]|nr:outer membrane protein assembly factor BamB [Chromatiales bacterium]